jgi:hypothetical protein
MSAIRQFSLAGVGSNVQLGKAGSKLIGTATDLSVKNAAESALVPVNVGTPTLPDHAVTLSYVNGLVTSAVVYRGTADASQATVAAAIAPYTTALANGDMFRVTVAGSVFGTTQPASVGDFVIYNGTTWNLIAGNDSSVLGTTDRITTTELSPNQFVVDIASTYIGQTTITTLGTVAAGTWNAQRQVSFTLQSAPYVNGGEAVVVREELTVGANSDSFMRECAYDQPRTLGVSLKAS